MTPEMVGLTYILYNDQVIRQIVKDKKVMADFTYPWEQWIEEEYTEPMPLSDLLGVA